MKSAASGRRWHQKGRIGWFGVAVLLLGAAMPWVGVSDGGQIDRQSWTAGSATEGVSRFVDDAGVSYGAGGMVLYRDPQTGELGTPPPGMLPPESADAHGMGLGSLSEDLVVRSGVTAAGGKMVDLRRRYRMKVMLRKEADGTVSRHCVTGDTPSSGVE